ncbi:MAG TPA: MATE family efflux transporter, partial [Parafilimonas sp.]|nr:MATE family efflux transporter [Parafilimonas sp.]
MPNQLQVAVSTKQILRIALPISLALMVPQFNFVINNVFLGHLSEQALATASITGVYYLIFTGIGFGLNNGLQALISRRAGENRPEEIGKIFNLGILISLLIAAGGIFITYFIAPAILKATIHSEETYKMSVEFLRIRIWGLPFLYIYQMRNALLVGTNQSKYLVAGTLAEAIANVVFDYMLIFGKWGLPALGFNGAAIASIVSEFIGMFVIYLVIAAKGIGKRFALLKNLHWDKENAKSIFHMSGPLIFQSAISIVSWIFFYILIEHHGKTSLAISNTMRNVFGFFGVFVWAFGATSNSMVSNVIGQGKKELVLHLVKKIMMLSMSIAIFVCILLNAFPAFYLSIYGQEGDFIKEGIPLIRLLTFVMILMSVTSVWLQSVTGTGNSRITFFIELAAIIFYCVYIY